MQEKVRSGNLVTPMLFPVDPELFWQSLRQIVREEVSKVQPDSGAIVRYDIPGMTYKPLFKMAEVCAMFQVSKPTIYDWIRHGKLRPHKIRSRVFFLWQDIEALLHPATP